MSLAETVCCARLVVRPILCMDGRNGQWLALSTLRLRLVMVRPPLVASGDLPSFAMAFTSFSSSHAIPGLTVSHFDQ